MRRSRSIPPGGRARGAWLPLAGVAALLAGGLTALPAANAVDAVQVTIPGNHNAAMGCATDWMPDCQDASLATRDDGIYSGTFEVPAGTYQFKAAVGGSWDESYGAGGIAGGDNIKYTTDGSPVTFYYDPATHYATNTAMGPLVTLAGSFQEQLGCSGAWQPDCMSSWLEDTDGDGHYTFTTSALATGSYQAKVAHGLSWDESYGKDGVKGGENIDFTATAGKSVSFDYDIKTHALAVTATDPPLPGTGRHQALWIDANTIAWPASLAGAVPAEQSSWKLYTSTTGGLAVTDGAVTKAAKAVTLDYDPKGLTAAQLTIFPAAKGYLALHPDKLSRDELATALTGELLVAQAGPSGTATAATGVQLPGVLDDLYGDAAKRTLGANWRNGAPSLALWAPTAQKVDLLLFPAGGKGEPLRIPAARQPDGSWTVNGATDWANREYLYEVSVYAPTTGKIEVNRVSDPYSVALTVNSTRSVLADLDSAALKPSLWSSTPSPAIASEAARTIYELHVRDFSEQDKSVPAALRGTYGAFATNSDGMAHLRELAKAGLNTVQLHPTFDIATINEDKAAQKTPPCDLASFGPAAEEQQACIATTAADDAYNWGYDPYHYMAPEGSYAVNADGGARVSEFRTMVGSLHASGLQVVLDQVFNHTSSSGQADTSVLDKVVPGYYQRLDANGNVQTSTCCQNVATEHQLAQKLMVDSVVTWARDYKVDGFRFDLMAFHSTENMAAVRAALDALTLAKDGVDGKLLALYGEGWNFGEVANNALFTQAAQGNLAGTGIGTFNDRLRDAVRGGSPVESDTAQKQGFGSGLSTDPNGAPANGDAGTQAAALKNAEDLIKVGLAGNLKDFAFLSSDGTMKTGAQIDYNGMPAGYGAEPDESVNYVDAHDNQSLFDTLAMKLPVTTTMADRVRMNTLSLAAATLSQSPSMWLAGSDMLRSKSLDNNSYDSGDWFNAMDWTGSTNNFGVGLPPKADNAAQWPVMKELLANPSLKPGPADIAGATAQAQEILRLKKSSPLFSLDDAGLIGEKISFPDTSSTPGVIAMNIDDTKGTDKDMSLDAVLVLFNAGTAMATAALPVLAGAEYSLSPVQATGADPVVKASTWDSATGTFSVPARSVVVLERKQVAASTAPTSPATTTPAPTAATASVPASPAAAPALSSGPANPRAEAPERLASTGSTVVPLVLAAGMLLALGVVLALRRRRNYGSLKA
jgi:pullulanase